MLGLLRLLRTMFLRDCVGSEQQDQEQRKG
jgi:hypothetical protein